MFMLEPTEDSGPRPDEDFDLRFFGEGHPAGLPVFEAPVGAHLHNRKKVNSPSQLLALQEQLNFKPIHVRWRIAKDLVGLIRRGKAGETDESYLDKLRRETGRGKSESSTFGLATVAGRRPGRTWPWLGGRSGRRSGRSARRSGRSAPGHEGRVAAWGARAAARTPH